MARNVTTRTPMHTMLITMATMATMGRTKHPARVLIIATNTPAYELAGYRTGLWLGELTHFYDVLAWLMKDQPPVRRPAFV